MHSSGQAGLDPVPYPGVTTPPGPAANLTLRPLLRRLLLGAAILVLFVVGALLLSVAIGFLSFYAYENRVRTWLNRVW